jgi:hypothetical protein
MNRKQKTKKISPWLIVVAVVIMLVGIWMLLLFRAGRIGNPYSRLNSGRWPIPASTVKKNPPLGLADLDAVASWMTFDYLDKAFNLPADYLRTRLAITDARYPLLTINRFARLQKIDSDTALSQVRQAIADYLNHK